MSSTRFNRPGLPWLPYRAGTYGSFMVAMKARLSSADYAALARLTTRDGSDPAIALLDVWAMVADVLTFYEERDANEGFLRTATEDRSVFELARLIGYRPRPGVAASVVLAYGLEKDARLTIKRGSRVQSVPGPGQLPQTYETSADLVGRAEWNAIRPRLGLPQPLNEKTPVLYFKGASLGLKPNDPLLFVESGAHPKPARFARIHAVETFFERDMTKVILQPAPNDTPVAPDVTLSAPVTGSGSAPGTSSVASFTAAALAVATRFRSGDGEIEMARWSSDEVATSQVSSTVLGDVLAELDPRVSSEMVQSVASLAAVTPPPPLAVYAFRVQAGPFGHSAPKRPKFARDPNSQNAERSLVGYDEWLLGSNDTDAGNSARGEQFIGFESSESITLDSARDGIVPDSWVAIIRPGLEIDDHLVVKQTAQTLTLWRAKTVEPISRADYGVSARATRIGLEKTEAKNLVAPAELTVPQDWKGWLQPEIKIRAGLSTDMLAEHADTLSFGPIREVVVHAQSERLELAEAPDPSVVEKGHIELERFFPSLEIGRWMIVEGERADLISGADGTGKTGEAKPSGVRAAEIVQVVWVDPRHEHGPGDTVHTHIDISPPLANKYKRDTVTIYANIVQATHGETRQEVLGSGDAATPYQSFSLKQGPMTFVPAVTPSGVSSTLEVRVNDLEWREVPGLIDANGDERAYATESNDQGGVRVTFGDGVRGARVPTGVENVKARYRVGIGAAGNAPAGQISQLMDRPLGAKDVRNPLPALGGADRDTAHQARELAPLSVQALDRLVSATDYQHFAQLFAGIAKATASEAWVGLPTHARTKIVIAVAAVSGMPIVGSALHGSLVSALRQFGDPARQIEVVDADRYMLVLSAGIRLLPGYLFEAVRPQIEQALFDAFGFERRRLGDDLHLSEVLQVMQSVDGVLSVDVDVFATISDADLVTEAAFDAKLQSLSGKELPPERLPIVPTATSAAKQLDDRSSGWLLYLSPRVPRSVLLQEIE